MIPYRVKNPPERFPYVTIGLMVVNTLIYFVTTDNVLTVRESVVEDWALSHATFSVVRLFAAMFLHGSLFHLLGNMLFLWIFGAAVEGRLGPLRFILSYLLCGLAGNLLHDGIAGIVHPKQFVLGASGAIMGLAGGYLYLFPFARICIFWGWNWWRFAAGLGATSEWQAQWVILYYLGFDLLEGFLFSTVGVSGGVANFAHLGGAGAGFLMMLALRQRRDTEEASDAQALRTEYGGDWRSLPLPELEALVRREPDHVEMVVVFCQRALLHSSYGSAQALARSMFLEKADLLVQRGDAESVGKLTLLLASDSSVLPTSVLLRVAARTEREGEFGLADQLMRRVLSFNDSSPDAEMVWARLARLTEQSMGDKAEAVRLYQEQLRRFPNGAQATYAHAALTRLGGAVKPPAPPSAPPAPTPLPTAPLPRDNMPGPRRKASSEASNTEEGKSAESSGLRPLGG